MKEYDKEKILSEVTGFMVVDMLGLDFTKKGKYTWIYCPGHTEGVGKADTHMSNCVVTDYGYYCFACHRGRNVISMTMESTGCSYQEALEMLSDYIGGAEINVDERKGIKKFCPLTQEDLLLLGLCPKKNSNIKIIKNITEEPVSNHSQKVVEFDGSEDIVYYENFQHVSVGIGQLFQEDKEAYHKLIQSKFVEQYEDVLRNIMTLKRKANSPFWGPFYYMLQKKKRKMEEMNARLQIIA